MRIAAKVDKNQADMIQALRDEGCSVFSLAGMGKGCPDLLVGIASKTYLVEVKDGARYGKSRSIESMLTKDQKTFIAKWTGSPVVILKDIETAKAWVSRLQQGETS
jgi:Holliday junction resolvase